jgi:hypothetical protein
VQQINVLGRTKEPNMNERIDLDQIRKNVYLIYSEDGLADLAVGLMIFGFGIFLLLDQPALVGLLGIISFLVWYLGKINLVIPRVGSIQPSKEMKNRFLGFFISLMLIGLGILVFYLAGGRTGMSIMRTSPLMIFGMVVALGISVIGLVLQARRFYLYGVLVFAAMTVGEFLSTRVTRVDPFLIAVISAGGLILLAGLIVLVSFLKRYPVVEQEG